VHSAHDQVENINCENYDCHTESVEQEICFLPVKRDADIFCHIPCQLANCSQEVVTGVACTKHFCTPKNVEQVPMIESTMVTTTPTTAEASTKYIVNSTTTREAKSGNCDEYDCHVETIQEEVCVIPVKHERDIYCVIPCQLDNCSSAIITGVACPKYFCIPKIQPTPPSPPGPPKHGMIILGVEIGAGMVLFVVVLVASFCGIRHWRRTRNFQAFVDEPEVPSTSNQQSGEELPQAPPPTASDGERRLIQPGKIPKFSKLHQNPV